MPIYEYECLKCKAHVEAMQKVSDKPLTRCRKCGGKLEKQWSQTSFQLKGSGWYATDYAGKKGASREETKGETKEATKGETRSAAPESAGAGDKAAGKETSAAPKSVPAEKKPAPSSRKASGD